MDRNELARKIFDTSYLEGSFTLRSVHVSNEYFDKYLFESNPKLLMAVANQLSELLPDGQEILTGIEMACITFA